MEKNELDAVGVIELFELLPHRYPFLLIDKIMDINKDLSAVGIKNVTINEPFFVGHFPREPIMPGVLIIESMAQTASAICIRQHDDASVRETLIYFMSIEGAKFRNPVIPGDVLKLYVTQTKRRRDVFKYDCEARVDEKKVAEAVLTATIRIDPKDS